MTSIELLVIVVCVAIGYIVVHQLITKDDTPFKWPGDTPGQGEPNSQRQENPSPGKQQKQPHEKYEPFGPRWATVLGVRPTATREEIRAAYRRKISEYRPDKVTQLGPKIRELAEQRSKEINAAYDEAMRRYS